MINFWPEGLVIQDVRSPMDILKQVNEEFKIKSKNSVSLCLDYVYKNGLSKGWVLIKVESNIFTNAFLKITSLSHGPYPVQIHLGDEIISTQNFLSRIDRGNEELPKFYSAYTPAEFSKVLVTIFNLRCVKSTLCNLVIESKNKNNKIEGKE